LLYNDISKIILKGCASLALRQGAVPGHFAVVMTPATVRAGTGGH
jgi:hypothetical protein